MDMALEDPLTPFVPEHSCTCAAHVWRVGHGSRRHPDLIRAHAPVHPCTCASAFYKAKLQQWEGVWEKLSMLWT